MELEINSEIEQNIDEYRDIYPRLLEKALKMLNVTTNVIMSVTFVDEDMIHEINKTYRNIDRPTDVISFAFLDDKSEKIVGDVPLDLGEIYICYDVADKNRLS